MKDYTVTVIGATGYIGRIIALDLKRRKVNFAITGRNSNKLEVLKKELGDDIPSFLIELSDQKNLIDICKKSKVIINAAGPYSLLHGENVVKACIEGKAHYIDMTDEQGFVRQIIPYDEEAKKANVAIINGAGIGVALPELIVKIASQDFNEVEEVEVIYLFPLSQYIQFSGGSTRSILVALKSEMDGYENGKWVKTTLGAHRKTFYSPPPNDKRVGITISGVEILTIPRFIKTKSVRVYMALIPTLGYFISFIMPFLKWIVRSSIGKLIEKILGSKVYGPKEDARSKNPFYIKGVVKGISSQGKVETKSIIAHGLDGYLTTAVITVQAALWMAEPSFNESGVIPFGKVFEPKKFLEPLKEFNLNWFEEK